LKLDFFAYRRSGGQLSISASSVLCRNGKFGALPVFLAAKSGKPLSHYGRGYALSGRLSMRSSIKFPAPGIRNMTAT